MLPQSISKNEDFKIVYKRGKKIVSKQFVFYFYKNKFNFDRIGFTVSKKIGNAVLRNKLRRKLREVFRLNFNNTNKGYDIVLVARNKLKYVKYKDIDNEFKKVLGEFKGKIK